MVKDNRLLIQVRATKEEKKKIRELAKKENRSTSQYMKLKSLNKI